MTHSLLAVSTLIQRELIRFYRQRSRIIGSLASPFLFWLFLGSGLQAAFPVSIDSGGRGYLEYFFPGNLALTILFTSIFSNISIIEDRHEGFLQSVLVAPISRFSVVGGKVGGGSLIAFFQGMIFLSLAPVAGIPLTVESVALATLAILAMGLTLTALGFIFAWWLDSVQGFHSIMNVFLLPMWLLSGAFFPLSGAPAWLRPIMAINPVTYGVAALERALYPGERTFFNGVPSFEVSLGVTLLFGALFYLICLGVVNREGKRKVV